MRWMYKWIQFCFPNIEFYKSYSNKWHLTIDDSPSNHTPWILDLLDFYQVKATFFCVGKNIEIYPNNFQLILDRGHEVGYHSYYHINAWRQSKQDFVADFEKCEALFPSSIYRPPYGKLTWFMYRYLKKKGIKIILWDILAEDWKKDIEPIEKIKTKIKSANEGSIFVFHDNEKSMDNLRIMLPYFLETVNGY
jgi:peptidoglycan/xylan/chitin deacetylase (PgdA/CDA1 family)